MNNRASKTWFPVFALLVFSGISPGIPAEGSFTLEQVLSAPYPTTPGIGQRRRPHRLGVQHRGG